MTAPIDPWRLDLPLTKPLSLNDRSHWRKKARQVAQLRRDVAWLARAAKIPACPRIAVELHYAPRDSRRRDRDNLVATHKPCVDALVDAGIVPDDTPTYVEPKFPVIDEPTREGPVLYLLIERIEPHA